MNLLASALVMGLLFLPGSTMVPAHAEASSATPATLPASGDDPSPKKVVATAPAVPTGAYHVKLTGYNAVPEQTDGDPLTTASGAASNAEVVAARSIDLADELPFGTVVQITREYKDTPGCNFHKIESLIGYRVIADTMNARWEKRVDVQLNSNDKVAVEGKMLNPGLALGVCSKVEVRVVGHVSILHMPKTQADLAKLFQKQELAINA